MPDVTSVTTMVLHSIVSELKTRGIIVHITWFIYSPDKLDSLLTSDSDSFISSIHDYNNAFEVLKKEKPDIIYATTGWGFIDYAFSLAGKFLNIPVVSHVTTGFNFKTNRLTLIKSYITRFFESSIPTDTGQNKKQFMRRGRFFVYKYLFLVRTQRAMKWSILQIFKNFFILLKLFLSSTRIFFDSRFGGTLHFLDNENLLNDYLDGGFERSQFVITGNPIYDEFFHKLSIKKDYVKGNKIRILFAPTPKYEHGFWTRTQRDTTITQIVKTIFENKQEMSLVVKIHPSYSVLSEYQSLINSIDPSIPVYKNGNIQEFVENADVVLSFQFTTADVYSILAKKPIILCNFFNYEKDPFVQRGLALECNDSADLINTIHNALSTNPKYEQQRELFIREFLYKSDGRATERICDEIMKLLDKN
ncbi:MAG TPA: CDP-glycerol glycerophosphotransferase family protein [Nitrosopumilaceae archaeon]|nr:CDP-glycerol glycerophosphotransferase family protein [Nitrosopumilaceae archaeon]